MAVKINIEEKKQPEIKAGSIVHGRLCGNSIVRMVIQDYDSKHYKLLDLTDGMIYGEDLDIKSLLERYNLKLATNDITITLHDVENI